MKQDLRTAAIGALGGAALMLLMAQTPMAIRSDGIQFTDGSVQTSADLRRTFYLTNLTHWGSDALSACEPGFHMASLWEIFDVSALRYATGSAYALHKDDSGQGPPSGSLGWIRTGKNALGGSATAGSANCDVWLSTTPSTGSLVELDDRWNDEDHPPLGPWNSQADFCSDSHHVWCVED